MTTTAILPDHFELHEGDEFDLHAVAKNGSLIITQVRPLSRTSRREEQHLRERQARKDAAFKTFAVGVSITPALTDQDLDDARLEYLMEKHVK